MTDFTLDLPAYLARIGYDGPLDCSVETLRGLHRAQAFSMPFENLDIHLNRPIRLDSASLVQKLVYERRGGYCYELNGLFRLVLEQLGFAVTGLVGRNLISGPPLRPRAHQVLLVMVEGQSWLADLGFGSNGLLEPIPLQTDVEFAQLFERYRLLAAPHSTYHLQLLMLGEWQTLYEFGLHEQQPSDYHMMSYYYSQAPDSPFRQQRISTRATPTYRVSLLDRQLKFRHADGTSTSTELTDDAEYHQALQTHFGIQLPT